MVSPRPQSFIMSIEAAIVSLYYTAEHSPAYIIHFTAAAVLIKDMLLHHINTTG